jgi:hypothetical protein
MAIHFTTKDAQSLLKAFDARIAQAEPKGKITTWEKSSDGKYYTHKAPEWNKEAWICPKIEATQLTFNIIKPKNKNIDVVAYAYYHGHLIETFLNHFNNAFQNCVASALPEAGDLIKS